MCEETDNREVDFSEPEDPQGDLFDGEREFEGEPTEGDEE